MAVIISPTQDKSSLHLYRRGEARRAKVSFSWRIFLVFTCVVPGMFSMAGAGDAGKNERMSTAG